MIIGTNKSDKVDDYIMRNVYIILCFVKMPKNQFTKTTTIVKRFILNRVIIYFYLFIRRI